MEDFLEYIKETDLTMIPEYLLTAACAVLIWQLKKMLADSSALREELDAHKVQTAEIIAELRVEALKQMHELHNKYTSELLDLERRIQGILPKTA